jgi:hypothetical protein
MISDTPIFDHDCKVCQYLGSDMTEGRYYDLWFAKHQNLPSVIIRWGSQPPDYESFLLSMLKTDDFGYHPLRHAIKVLKQLGSL